VTSLNVLRSLLLLTLVGAAYEWAWLPYTATKRDMHQQAQAAEASYWWAQEQIAVLSTSGKAPVRAVTLDAIEAAMRRFRLRQSVTRMEPRDGALHLVFDDARFENLLRWFALINRELGLAIEAYTLSPGSTHGFVGGTVLITGLQR
jgi:type II secretory pathway component PulM